MQILKGMGACLTPKPVSYVLPGRVEHCCEQMACFQTAMAYFCCEDEVGIFCMSMLHVLPAIAQKSLFESSQNFNKC